MIKFPTALGLTGMLAKNKGIYHTNNVIADSRYSSDIDNFLDM